MEIRDSAYNNNYYKFENVGKFAKVFAEGKTYTMSPEKGTNEFNFIGLSSSLFSHKDAFNYDSNLVDTNQAKEIIITINTYESENVILTTKEIKATFFNGSFQRWECNDVDDEVVNLSEKKMPYFVGYPFDYSKIEGNSIIRQLVSNGVTIGNDVNVRSILSDCDGYLLKWHNNSFGYCYYLFQQIGKEKKKAKSIGLLKEHFAHTDNTLELGKIAQRTMSLFANVDWEDREIMKSLVSSDEVYLYTGKKNELATNSNWLEVRINTSYSGTNKKTKFKQLVQVLLPQEQTRRRL